MWFSWKTRKSLWIKRINKNIFFLIYRDILSMMWLILVSEKPGMSLWIISFTKRSVTPGQLRSADSNDERKSIKSVEFRLPLLLLLLYWLRLLVIYIWAKKRKKILLINYCRLEFFSYRPRWLFFIPLVSKINYYIFSLAVFLFSCVCTTEKIRTIIWRHYERYLL